jgi:hypothetical protein
MGKVFKQITDSWSEKAAADQDRAPIRAGAHGFSSSQGLRHTRLR